MTTRLQNLIDAAFEDRQNIKVGQKGEIAEAVEAALGFSTAERPASQRKRTASGSCMRG